MIQESIISSSSVFESIAFLLTFITIRKVFPFKKIHDWLKNKQKKTVTEEEQITWTNKAIIFLFWAKKFVSFIFDCIWGFLTIFLCFELGNKTNTFTNEKIWHYLSKTFIIEIFIIIVLLILIWIFWLFHRGGQKFIDGLEEPKE